MLAIDLGVFHRRSHAVTLKEALIWSGVWIGIGYAITDEVHQTFVPGRHGAAYDVVVDAAGVLLGVYVVSRLARRVLA